MYSFSFARGEGKEEEGIFPRVGELEHGEDTLDIFRKETFPRGLLSSSSPPPLLAEIASGNETPRKRRVVGWDTKGTSIIK